MGNVIGKIPDFTTDESASGGENQEVLDKAIDAATGDGAATTGEGQTPTEPPAATEVQQAPAEEKPADGGQQTPPAQDTGQLSQLEQTIQGLQSDKSKLLREIATLRGQKREIKQEQLSKVQEQLDELSDINPEDVTYIERVLRAKGYVTKEEQQKMFYDAVKQEELNRFLEKYPEYKPENDPNDTNWSALQAELGDYRLPSDPHGIGRILEKAHRNVKPLGTVVPSGPSVPAKKRQIEVAGAGAGGTQRPSTSGNATLDPERKAMLRQGGFSDEDIKSIEQRLGTV